MSSEAIGNIFQSFSGPAVPVLVMTDCVTLLEFFNRFVNLCAAAAFSVRNSTTSYLRCLITSKSISVHAVKLGPKGHGDAVAALLLQLLRILECDCQVPSDCKAALH